MDGPPTGPRSWRCNTKMCIGAAARALSESSTPPSLSRCRRNPRYRLPLPQHIPLAPLAIFLRRRPFSRTKPRALPTDFPLEVALPRRQFDQPSDRPSHRFLPKSCHQRDAPVDIAVGKTPHHAVCRSGSHLCTCSIFRPDSGGERKSEARRLIWPSPGAKRTKASFDFLRIASSHFSEHLDGNDGERRQYHHSQQQEAAA